MELLTSLLIAVGLAMDAFAVSLGIGTARQAEDRRARFRLSFHFGFFQAMMTVLGYGLGSSIAGFIDGFDHWVALALLAYVGLGMIHSGISKDDSENRPNPSKGRILMLLCVATSIDAMAVGLSMAVMRTEVWFTSVVIGVVTYGLSYFGLRAGGRLGAAFGRRMEVLGGLILLGIGLRVVITHLVG